MTANRRYTIYTITMGCVVAFVTLTILAMLLYPGGTWGDPTTEGYRFFQNFFSDLGVIESPSGEAKVASTILFVLALISTGAGLVIYFIVLPYHFQTNSVNYWLARIGSFFGIVTGIAYVGVAATPADRLLDAHGFFVQVAFLAFFFATTLYSIAIFRQPTYPNQYAAVFAVFTVVLLGYLYLLFFGPSLATDTGLIIQATGQKIIVYTAVICMFIEAAGSRGLVKQQTT